MTAVRVFHPVVLTEFCKMRASPSAVGRNLPCGRQLNRIKRDLFGAANPAETTKIFTEEIEKHQEKAMKRWGFDFRTGVPACPTNSQYIWERVSYQESSVVPEMYTLTRAAHVRPEQAELTSNDVLMDERAERENLANISASTDESCDDESQDESLPVVFKVPSATVGNSPNVATTSTVRTNRPNLRKRQPKITEYMKERKRLAPTPKKASPMKRMRTSSGSSSGSGSGTSSGFTHSAHGQSIASHFAALRSNLQRQQQH